MPFFLFLGGLIGALSGILSPYYFLLLLPLGFLWFRKYGLTYRILWLILPCLALFLWSFFYPKGSLDATTLDGLVIQRKSSYYLLLTGKGTYYLYDKGKGPTLFSFVHLQGYADTLSFSHHESGFSFETYLRSQGTFYQFHARTTEITLKMPDITGFIRRYAFSSIGEDHLPLAEALLFSNGLSNTGFAFLLEGSLLSLFSLSGLHLLFLSRFLQAFCRPSRKKAKAYINLAVMSFFFCLSPMKFTLQRLWLEALFKVIGHDRKTHLSSLDRFSIICLILLGMTPYLLLQASFYQGVPFIFFLRFFPKTKGSAHPRLRFYGKLFLFFLPFRFLTDYGIAVADPLFQILLLPYSHLLFLIAALSFLFPPIGALFNPLSKGLLYLGNTLLSTRIYLTAGRPSPFWITAYFGILCLVDIIHQYGYRKEKRYLWIVLIGLLTVRFLPVPYPRHSISFIDVDQGASALVIQNYKAYLFDTGGILKEDLATTCLVPYFRKKKIYRLEAVFITHDDYDHSGALKSLRDNFPVRNIYTAKDLLALPEHTLTIGSFRVTNLNDAVTESQDSNSQSGVYRFDVGTHKILITGDAPKAVERKILKSHPEAIDVDYLALGHHGSRTSSDSDFVKACSPKLCIISCGKNNSYGFPHQETLMTLKSLNLAYRRTDIEGTIDLSWL